MNLAEIRKKARLEKTGQACRAPSVTPSRPEAVIGEQAVEVSPGEVYHAAPLPDPGTPRREADAHPRVEPVVRENFDPVGVLLEGRRRAGTAADTVEAHLDETSDSSGDILKYLRFRVADEDYGLSLLEIREIIKPRAVTEVPRMPVFVAGVLSLRGVIIPVFDLRPRLGLPPAASSGTERIIIVKKEDGACGLLVDEVFQVIGLKSSEIEKAPQVLEGMDREFVTGIGRHGGRMLILLDLEKIVNVSLR